MTEQNGVQNTDAQPALPPDVQEMAAQAQEQGISLREYIRRTAQSVIDTEASKVKGELQQTVSVVTERQQAIQDASAEFDDLVKDMVEQGVDLEGKDLVSMKNKHIAKRVPAPAEPTPEPEPQPQQQSPMMAAALQLAAEQGLVRGDPEMQSLNYSSWGTLMASILDAGDKKKQRLTAPASLDDTPPTDAPPSGMVVGEVGGGRGGAPTDNPIENIDDPDQLLGMVDWTKTNLPPEPSTKPPG